MRLIVSFFLACILSFSSCFAQQDTVFIRYTDKLADALSYKVDTLLYSSILMSSNILVGTTALPNTENQMAARSYGLHFIGVEASQCDDTPESRYKWQSAEIPHEIIKVEMTDSLMSVDISLYSNCCYDFLCDVAVLEGGVLNLIYHAYGKSHCTCSCCFGLNYQMSFPFEAREGKKLTGVVINGDMRTLKKLAE